MQQKYIKNQNLQNSIIQSLDSAIFLTEKTALGNITSYFATPANSEFQPDQLKHDYKEKNILRKHKVGEHVKRVKYCGIAPIQKGQHVEAVQGEKGGVYYRNMQRCGSVWFCPDCMYKLMKERSSELQKQLIAYKEKGKKIIFSTLTLQHNFADSLESLHHKLLQSYQFANSHRTYTTIKGETEYLRVMEVLHGANGWHIHLHTVFVGNSDVQKAVDVFEGLYKRKLLKFGLLVNGHTTKNEEWNGKVEDMNNYLFKGMLEKEMLGGGISKDGAGKTFMQLIDENENSPQIIEFIKVMKGKRQFRASKNFFADVREKTDEEILRDDKIDKVLFRVPAPVFVDMKNKGIAERLLNTYRYLGKQKAVELLELYDIETDFINTE